MTHPMIPRTTQTRIAIDEWGTEHYPQPLAPLMDRQDMAEASRLLSSLHELVGVQADEVMAFLTTILVERDEAAMRLLRWLRSLDAEARQ